MIISFNIYCSIKYNEAIVMTHYFKSYLLIIFFIVSPVIAIAQQPNFQQVKIPADSALLVASDSVSILTYTDTVTQKKKKRIYTADTLFLKNGDKITGKILSLEQGRIKIDAQGPGVVTIKWYKIATIAGGNRVYKIEDVHGGIYIGRIGYSADTGKIIVERIISLGVLLKDITKVYPIEEDWYRGFKGSFGGGLSYAKASDVLTINTEYNLYYVLSKWTFINDFSFVSNSTNSEVASLRIQANLQALYSLPKRWLLSEINSYNKNDELGINSRYTVGVQAGNNLVQTDWQRLIALSGINLNYEKYIGLSNGSANLEWPVSVQHTIYKFMRPNLSSSTAVTYYKGITDSGRNRVDASTDITWEFITNYKLKLAFYYDFDNKVIEGKTSNTNYGTTISLLIDLK